MKQKTNPKEIAEEVQSIGDALKLVFDQQKSNLRTIAKYSDMSVNSVKAVLSGKTANIASYSLVAKALGTTLVDVVVALNNYIPGNPTLPAIAESASDPIDNLFIQ